MHLRRGVDRNAESDGAEQRQVSAPIPDGHDLIETDPEALTLLSGEGDLVLGLAVAADAPGEPAGGVVDLQIDAAHAGEAPQIC